jgi:chromate transporter
LSSNNLRLRWSLYGLLGAVAAVLVPAYVVVVLLACGAVELLARRDGHHGWLLAGVKAGAGLSLGLLGALAWTAFKVGALSYGGGFVIIPLMQHDVVSVHHWMTGSQFLYAVALGQITPGPVVLTTAVVGYAAHGLLGAGLATCVAFGPSFVFILVGGRSFERLRASTRAAAFLAGAGPAVIGAIAGSSLALGLLLHHLWQVPLLVLALGWLFWRKGSGLVALLVAAGLGAALVPFLH